MLFWLLYLCSLQYMAIYEQQNEWSIPTHFGEDIRQFVAGRRHIYFLFEGGGIFTRYKIQLRPFPALTNQQKEYVRRNYAQQAFQRCPRSPTNDWKCVLAQGSPKQNPLRFSLLNNHICQKSELGVFGLTVTSILLSGWCAGHRVWCCRIRLESCLFTGKSRKSWPTQVDQIFLLPGEKALSLTVQLNIKWLAAFFT